MKKVRCAIYTRKSSEEGLEQDFNSLDAQSDACAAYITSQTSEGRSLIGNSYDDGGISGGTMKRPALQRLLKDIRDGKIDIVVVYKVDRLTRSLLDFAKLVETMDKAEVSFVSVTQSFNMTNSMGRLTLNMLLSFAQFEREVTAERIRDKIAASKAKGMWMGGVSPLGYEPNGRTLRIIEEHAVIIRDLFERYRKYGNVRLVFDQLIDERIKVPKRTLRSGKAIGGSFFTRGQIYRILSNPIYIGEIQHKDRTYKGQHKPIIDRDVWNAVQCRLGENRQGEQRSKSIRSPSMLAGKVSDESGEPLVASHACKGKIRYRFYVSRSLQHDGGRTAEGWRIPAKELEGAVIERLASELEQPLALIEQMGGELSASSLSSLSTKAEALAARIREKQVSSIRPLIEHVKVSAKHLDISLHATGRASELSLPATQPIRNPTLAIDVCLKRTGRALQLVQSNGRSGIKQVDATLLRLVQQGRSWWEEIVSGQQSIAQFARGHDVTASYVTRMVRLAFLSPQIVEAVATGTQPVALTPSRLRTVELPASWSDQQKLLGT
ncbi:recombinase family protein [Aurantiacibacter gangjinensis]|uniref:Resolvase n=1 Tax=Aurantiacibacter gangjinensis TaxID=502682 RepID=A0A0G9MMX2_9SPHN|nr:recombinase family protein [Aurantiacibacter gangjinensis]APE28048.1 Resolvase, N-terminal domain [Aurantiacibacter gangjinensis]KLE31974.1 resolvase [Aurantiacibacter gangjinensis]